MYVLVIEGEEEIMVHALLVGFDFRGRTVRISDGHTYVNLIFEDPDGCDQVRVGVPENRREDTDVRALDKGDVCDVPVSIYSGTSKSGNAYTSWTLAGDISVNIPDDDVMPESMKWGDK